MTSGYNILRKPVTEPAAWTTEDLAADRSWLQTLTPAELAEIDVAVAVVRSKGLATFEFTRDDFPLPRLGARLRDIARDLEHGRGVVLLRGLAPERYDIDALYALYWGLAVHLGTPISQNAKGDLIGQVTDSGQDYQTKNVRGYTTRAALRPHCDASDVVGLLCVHPAKTGGASCIASAATIYNTILAERPEFIAPLCRGFHFDLRGEGVTDDPDEVTFNRVPVFSYFDGWLSCRYNGKTIIDGMAKSGAPLSDDDLAAVEFVRALAMRPGIRFDMGFRPGDIQLLNNHMVLHSRTDFEDWPEPARKRRLLRLWLNLDHGRALAPAFADRLNTGPRGGVMARATDRT